MKTLNILIKIALAIAVVVAIYYGYDFLQNRDIGQTMGRFGDFRQRGNANNLGIIAAVSAGAAFLLWLSRNFLLRMNKNKGESLFKNFVPFFKKIMPLLKKNHTYFGWAALIIVTAHGIYYTLNEQGKTLSVYTGWTDWGAFVLLALIGYGYSRKIKKKQSVKKARSLHISLAFVFVGLAVIHIL